MDRKRQTVESTVQMLREAVIALASVSTVRQVAEKLGID
jgi:hypothetical protein